MKEIALFGAGRIGKVHVLAVRATPGVRIKYIYDKYAPAGEALAKECGAKFVTEDEIWNDPVVTAVIIASSTDTHCELMIKAGKAGKAVFCEKPVDLDTDKALDCYHQLKSLKSMPVMAFNRRHDQHFGQLFKRVRAGEIGKIESVHITSRDPGLPPLDYIKVSGGIFKDMMIHDFDMARWMLGEEINTVFATGECLIDPEVKKAGDFDTAHAILQTTTGKTAIITNSRRSAYGYDQRLEVFGELGMLQAANQTETLVSLHNKDSIQREKPLHFFLERYKVAYENEIKNFIASLDGKEQPVANIVDGLESLFIADAALESAKTNKVVQVKHIS